MLHERVKPGIYPSGGHGGPSQWPSRNAGKVLVPMADHAPAGCVAFAGGTSAVALRLGRPCVWPSYTQLSSEGNPSD